MNKMAAGLGLLQEDIATFREAINQSASKLHEDQFLPKESISGKLKTESFDIELLNILEKFYMRSGICLAANIPHRLIYQFLLCLKTCPGNMWSN